MSHHNRVITAVAGGAALAYWLPSVVVGVRPLRRVAGVRDRVPAPDGVALTFDDGPHPQGTQAVLETLDAAGASATFFVVGEQVEQNPSLAAEIVVAGHEVALHCHRHRNLLRLTPAQIRDDLRRALTAIGDATGVAPRLYRPPYGIFNAAALRLARQLAVEPWLWTRDGRDWRADATSESIAGRVTGRLRGGDVLLLHDSDAYSAPGSWRRTARALPVVLDEIERHGLRPVRL
jgi:peptidoglycan/xylan/chitin deacetylase (PgdA/CDA1 family)